MCISLHSLYNVYLRCNQLLHNNTLGNNALGNTYLTLKSQAHNNKFCLLLNVIHIYE